MGRSEYRFATQALREGRLVRAFGAVAAACCFGLTALLIAVQFHPSGPAGPVARWVQIGIACTGVIYGMVWLLGPWPRYRYALAFVVWGDVGIAATAATMATPDSRLCATLYLGLVGVFAAFLLGAETISWHCAFGALVIVGITAWAVLVDHASAFGLFIYFMPALTWVVAVPLAGLALIEGGRRAIRRTARSAHYDPLTRLRNRRGLNASFEVAIRRQRPGTTVVIAVCDIDRFKMLNDVHGHPVGDAALIAMAVKLRAIACPEEITARIGGDELVLVVFRNETNGSGDLLNRLSALTFTRIDTVTLTASIGVASHSVDDPYFSLDDLLRQADAAMYEAKRAGGANLKVHQRHRSESTGTPDNAMA
ncbi:GGDEF domain-containing protein [Mycobacterium kiyosense]|uniref:GGDEF domain-containing protein n=1 Tax=Mycobacterium kiyosense TaxID=2871094 RepID=UPI0022323BE7|nr:GGDEF domain-containing protein [Mycobacterium kiyosense]